MPTGRSQVFQWRIGETLNNVRQHVDLIRPRPDIEGGDITLFTGVPCLYSEMKSEDLDGAFGEQASLLQPSFTFTEVPIPTNITDKDQIIFNGETYNITLAIYNTMRFTTILNILAEKAR